MDINNIIIDKKFKDESPIKTVEHIKELLGKHGIKTSEKWMESSVPYCYSLRVSIDGTTFGSYGKGITKEFAIASAYGELMERFQLGYIGIDHHQKDGAFSVNDSQNETVLADTLLKRNRKWYEAFSEALFIYTGEEIDAEKILMQFADEDGNVVATPYYCINTKQKEYLPTDLRKIVYTTNGCAAGNTPEEAIVQALSELVERRCLVRMIKENVTPPVIPDEDLQKYDIAYKIISYLKDKGFDVIIKDCSFGEKFPVVSACIIDKNTGRYHTHFGAYPVLEIALQRALTESFQGTNIKNIAVNEDFLYSQGIGFDLKNLKTELVYGTSKKMTQFFVGTPKYPYNNNMGFTGGNNRQLLRECVEYFTQMGYDILVRDSSCLGFPTYQVIIPGYSEVFCNRLSPNHNERKFKKYSINTLRNPSKASLEEMLGFLMHTEKNSVSFKQNSNLPVNLTREQEALYTFSSLAFVSFALMRYADTLKYINKILENCPSVDRGFFSCLKRYVALSLNGYQEPEIKEILSFFHSAESVDELYLALDVGVNPFEKFTLHCDMNCSADCCVYNSCCKKYVTELTQLINDKTKQLDFDAFGQTLNRLLEK